MEGWMEHSEFRTGTEFYCDMKRYRTTDVGSRTVVAIHLDPKHNESWFKGPTYAVTEIVFDESDIQACELVEEVVEESV
jgi:hypothetical protein